MEEITDKYNQAIDDLQKGKEEDIRDFIRDFEDQPQALAIEIEQIFGFEYVE